MLKLMKHLKPFVGSIIVAILLLFVQAVCDLSLPDYMSDIVNVGIQQGGVENAVPKVIQASELDKINIFTSINKNNIRMSRANFPLLTPIANSRLQGMS